MALNANRLEPDQYHHVGCTGLGFVAAMLRQKNYFYCNAIGGAGRAGKRGGRNRFRMFYLFSEE